MSAYQAIEKLTGCRARRIVLGGFGVILFCLGEIGFPQPNDPAEFLKSVPHPPNAVALALRRCPENSDTLAARSLEKFEAARTLSLVSLTRDSLAAAHRKSKLSEQKLKMLGHVRNEIDTTEKILRTALNNATTLPTEKLLQRIKLIGEELDKELQQCPKVGGGQILDSGCVRSAELSARATRLDASHEFLNSVRASWPSILDSACIKLAAHEHTIDGLLSSAADTHLVFELKRLRHRLWNIVEPFIRTVDEITRLAVQFIR